MGKWECTPGTFHCTFGTLDNPGDRPRPAGGRWMSETIPTYELYGEAFPGTDLDVMHCETIASRSSLHGGRVRPHRHADLFQLLYVRTGEIRATLDGAGFEPRAPCLLAIPSITVHSFAFGDAMEGWVVTLPDVLIERLLAGAPGLLPHFDRPHV